MKRGHTVVLTAGSSWILLFITLALQFIQVPIALAGLTREEFGLFAICMQLLGFVMLLDLGVSSAFARLLIDGGSPNSSEYRGIWSSGQILLLAQALVMFAVVSALAGLIPRALGVPPELQCTARNVLWATGAVLALRHATGIYRIALFAGQKLAVSNTVETLASICRFVVFVVALKSGLGLWSYVWSIFAGVAVALVCRYALCWRYCFLARFAWSSESLARVRSLTSFGFDMFVFMLFNLAIGSLLLALSGFVLPLATVAILAVNIKPIQALRELFHRLKAAATPSFAELVANNDLDRFRFGWILLAKVLMTGTMVTSLAYAIWSPRVITAWTSRDMTMSAASIALLTLIPFRFIIHLLVVDSLYAFKKMDRVRIPLLLETMIFIAGVLLLGKRYGVNGCLIAFVVSFLFGAFWPACSNLFNLARFRKSDIAPLTLRLAVIIGLQSAAVFVFLEQIWSVRWPMLLGGTCAWLLANGILFLTITLNRGERVYMKKLLTRSP